MPPRKRKRYELKSLQQAKLRILEMRWIGKPLEVKSHVLVTGIKTHIIPYKFC
jgi:hypothetical protein